MGHSEDGSEEQCWAQFERLKGRWALEEDRSVLGSTYKM